MVLSFKYTLMTQHGNSVMGGVSAINSRDPQPWDLVSSNFASNTSELAHNIVDRAPRKVIKEWPLRLAGHLRCHKRHSRDDPFTKLPRRFPRTSARVGKSDLMIWHQRIHLSCRGTTILWMGVLKGAVGVHLSMQVLNWSENDKSLNNLAKMCWF